MQLHNIACMLATCLFVKDLCFYIILTQAITFLDCKDWSKVFLHKNVWELINILNKIFSKVQQKVLRIVGIYMHILKLKTVASSGAPNEPQTPGMYLHVSTMYLQIKPILKYKFVKMPRSFITLNWMLTYPGSDQLHTPCLPNKISTAKMC